MKRLPDLPKPTRYFGHSVLSPMYTKEEMLEYAKAAISMALEESTKDTERLDFLTEEQVDTIYLDDGRIIDIGGSGLPWDVRVAIDALMTPNDELGVLKVGAGDTARNGENE